MNIFVGLLAIVSIIGICINTLLIWDNGFDTKYKIIYKTCTVLMVLAAGLWAITYQIDNTGKTYIKVTEGNYYNTKSFCTKYLYSKDVCTPIEKKVKYKIVENPIWEKL